VSQIDLRSYTYQISDQTCYIRAAKKYNAVTEIVALDRTYYSMQTSLKIIDQACVMYGSTYMGRADAMRAIFNIHYNPPIPIDPEQGLYAFATHSPHHEDCIWIITKNIIRIRHGNNYSMIYFKNNRSLRVDLSKRRIDRLCSCLYQYILHFRKD